MPWAFLVWLLCFCLQAALVGIAFYTLIQLYDFEEDLLNNFDCAKRCNRLVVRRLCDEGTQHTLLQMCIEMRWLGTLACTSIQALSVNVQTIGT